MSTGPSLYRLPPSLKDDLEQLRQLTDQFKTGAIPAARYQAFRVPQGIYEQRENGTFMMRVRLPAGMFLPDQMRAVARISRTYGNGQLHLTSRQDIQIHAVKVDGLHPALVELAQAGLSTKGGGGNTVRNIAACHQAGVCPDEVFDVTPHVVGLTESMLPDPLSYQLPRKYKIAFSGCPRDCAGSTVNDLGFISKQQNGIAGFAVYVGGGMGASSRVGQLLEPFIPAKDVCRVAEAVKRVFDKNGNRKNRHRARLRFLIDEIGLEAFTKLYRAELAQIPELPCTATISPAPEWNSTDAQTASNSIPADAWRKHHILPQKQPGYHAVEVATPLGELDADQLERLAAIVDRHGERMLRATKWQNLVLRWVPEGELAGLRAELSDLGLGEPRPTILRHLVACAGASTCRLGVCLARGLARAITDALTSSDLDLNSAAGDLTIHISGCPNACGRHPVAQIGFFGAARRVGGHLVPHYIIQLGGHVEEGNTVLAFGTTSIPARNVPQFLVEFLQAYVQSQHSDFQAFLDSGGREHADHIAQRYAHVPSIEQDPSFYYDWGSTTLFSLAGRGPGECGAGVFDLIEIDLNSAAEALAAGKLFSATALASRALLVTRGEQADTDSQALTLFRKHFIQQNLISAPLHALIDNAIAAGGAEAFNARTEDVSQLLTEVKKLYEGMGPSLRVTAPACAVPPPAAPTQANITPDHTADFRGVVCPLNYVKTKMALAKLKPGQVLAVLLDEQGAKNVPASAANDGHEVLGMTQQDGHFKVAIRKKG